MITCNYKCDALPMIRVVKQSGRGSLYFFAQRYDVMYFGSWILGLGGISLPSSSGKILKMKSKFPSYLGQISSSIPWNKRTTKFCSLWRTTQTVPGRYLLSLYSLWMAIKEGTAFTAQIFTVLAKDHQSSSIQMPTRCTCHRVYFVWQLPYVFRVSPSPIFRSTKQL